MNIDGGYRWDSRDFSTGDQYDAWQAVLQNVYGSWDVSLRGRSGFDARMSYRGVGTFQIVDCLCDPCGARRTRTQLAGGNSEALTVQLVLSGRETFMIEDKAIDLGPGDVLIWNSTRRMSFEVKERLHKISVSMPLSRLRSWLPTTWHSIESSLPHVTPGAALLNSVISAMSPAFLAGDLKNSEALTESVLGLLVNVTGVGGAAEPATLRETQLLVVKDYIEANLNNPNLSPGLIAQAKRISLRYLHALFEREKTTVQQYVIRQRLLRCRRELENQKMAGRTVTDIAYSWGFQNSAHFSRRFKAEFGISPQDFRASLKADRESSLIS
jgi:AraC-like DNA-binding protein